MRVIFKDPALDRLETDIAFDGGYSPGVVSAFRKRMQVIRAATDERTFYGLKSLHFEKLKGARQQQRSMRLNDQFRLILELRGEQAERHVLVVGIEDYHK